MGSSSFPTTILCSCFTYFFGELICLPLWEGVLISVCWRATVFLFLIEFIIPSSSFICVGSKISLPCRLTMSFNSLFTLKTSVFLRNYFWPVRLVTVLRQFVSENWFHLLFLWFSYISLFCGPWRMWICGFVLTYMICETLLDSFRRRSTQVPTGLVLRQPKFANLIILY